MEKSLSHNYRNVVMMCVSIITQDLDREFHFYLNRKTPQVSYL